MSSNALSAPISRPPRLKPGDTLGVAAPAGPFDIDSFQQGMQVLRDMGFRLEIPEGVYKRNGFLAGADNERAAILNRLFADPDVRGIICARGGYGSTRLEPFLDWELIRANPKVFMGFSDITVLHHLIVTRGCLATFHGPMGTTLAQAPEDTRQAFMRALTAAAPITINAGPGGVVRPGEGRGPVAGGNLAMICHLLGTPLQPDFSGCLLFMEEVNEAPYRIDRMLQQMKLAGCFRSVRGIFFGDFVDCGAKDTIEAIISEWFADSAFPVLTGFAIGHGRRNLTLPMGLTAQLTSDPPQLRFDLPPTV
ncbi:MAG: LD-carboxypeptidase [Desulfobacterales bacterium]|nr:LD-carboxypeptidase [Desulfobacterales bacterium]